MTAFGGIDGLRLKVLPHLPQHRGIDVSPVGLQSLFAEPVLVVHVARHQSQSEGSEEVNRCQHVTTVVTIQVLCKPERSLVQSILESQHLHVVRTCLQRVIGHRHHVFVVHDHDLGARCQFLLQALITVTVLKELKDKVDGVLIQFHDEVRPVHRPIHHTHVGQQRMIQTVIQFHRYTSDVHQVPDDWLSDEVVLSVLEII